MTICKICHNSLDHKSYVVREMMFGFRDEFEYFECGECGCLQIKDIPNNISKYYPDNFYAFQLPTVEKEKTLKNFFRRQRMKYLISGNTNLEIFLSKVLRKLYKLPNYNYYDWLRKLKLPLNAKILDVGCGVGTYLLNMRADGFTDVTGVDPFIEKDIFYDNGVKILKKYLDEIEGQFDLIFLNHSFEHMPKPLAVLQKLYSLLNSQGYVVIGIPIVPSFAWRNYGVNWVQIDAPRHFFIHTIKSMEILTSQAGLKILDVEYNSNSYQFWGSEQIMKNIPIADSSSHAVNSKKSIFSKEQMKSFEAKAIELNRQKDGDQANLYLYKP
ncbi:class I SAM-dependent methyltransferase [Chlorogloeopsis sp. ULAP02]|uniref:class I SAM-dependent methyltransferase n=1 Tax=Chlorogloeopsis sp. ULAP02 TaxID=3107926 RepID=UPI0031349715